MLLALPRLDEIAETLRRQRLGAVELARPLNPEPLPALLVENVLRTVEGLDVPVMLHEALPLALTARDRDLGARIHDRVLATVDLAGRAGARSVTLHTTTTRALRPVTPGWRDPATLWLAEQMESGVTPDPAEAQAAFAQFLDELAPLAEGSGVVLAVENNFRDTRYFGERADSIDDVLEFVRRADSPSVGVCFDVYKAVSTEPSLPEAIRRCAGRLVDVHVSDYEPTDTTIGQTRKPLGDGRIDWSEVLHSLRDVDYDGPLILEMLGADADIEASVRHFESVLEALDASRTG